MTPVARTKISVLLPPEDFARFEAYCREKGFKKSTLIARLIREHLTTQNFRPQRELPLTLEKGKAPR